MGSNPGWSRVAGSPLVPSSSPGVGSPLVRISGFESPVNVKLNFQIASILYDFFYFRILFLTVTSHYDFIVEVMK